MIDLPLAARPFLPAGRGGLILIIGGLTMLASALFLLLVRGPTMVPAGRQDSLRRRAGGPQRRLRADDRALRLAARARRRNVGEPKVYQAAPDHCTLRLDRCPGRHDGRRQACTPERARMQELANGIVPGSRVEEFACLGRGDNACWFTVTWGHA